MTAIDTTAYEHVRLSMGDRGILTATITNPTKKNAVNAGIGADLDRLWRDIDADAEIRVVVLTGEGDAFCAGLDLSTLAGTAETGTSLRRSKAMAKSIRDRVFDIVMTRFEVMQPYKPALKRIWGYLCGRPGEAAVVLCSSLASQYWMLAGAGAKLDGPGGALRVTGLASIYAKVFQVWLGDTSPSLDKTMAALDKRLARGERMLTAVEQACADACRGSPRVVVAYAELRGQQACQTSRHIFANDRSRAGHFDSAAAVAAHLDAELRTDR